MVWYGPGWGQAGTAPSFLFKIFTAQGGVRAPLFVTGPGTKPGLVSAGLAHVTDVAATILDLAHVASNATEVDGKATVPVQGISWAPVLSGSAATIRGPQDVVGQELFGGRSIIQGDYSALYLSDLARNVDPSLSVGRWLLFNLKNDPGQTTDLSAQEPAQLQTLVAQWDAYAKRNGVILPAPGKPVGQIRNGEGATEAK
jgi:arylsulfatase